MGETIRGILILVVGLYVATATLCALTYGMKHKSDRDFELEIREKVVMEMAEDMNRGKFSSLQNYLGYGKISK